MIVRRIKAMIYRLLDIFFTVFHSALILFNLTGWMFKKARLLNLVILLVTGASWLILGLITGTMGYCPLTDWHFSVLNKLGKTGLPNSYIKYLSDRLTGLDTDSIIIDKITVVAFIVILAISVVLNIRDRRSSVH